jgi:hypothetical protein
MSRAIFRFYGRIDGATEGTVTIDRETDLVSVRPLRRRRVYELPLAWVANAVLSKVVKVELAEKRRLKPRRKR